MRFLPSLMNCIPFFFQDCVDAKIIVAGFSTTCSQKIHNQLVCHFFLFLSFSSICESKISVFLDNRMLRIHDVTCQCFDF